MQICDRLKIAGVSRAKRCISSSEFVDWKVYLDRDANAFHREDYYAAQIAAEVRRGRAKNPRQVKDEQFLIKFTPKKASPKTSKEAKLKASKAFWGSLVGLDEKEKD